MSSDISEGQIGQEQIDFSSSLSLSFNKQIARIYGLNAAVVFNHILYWLNINVSNPAAQKMGKTWMYESQEKMAEFLDCLSRREIQHALNILEESGLIIKENLNDNPFVKTNWYTVGDQKLLSGSVKKGITKAPAGAIRSPPQCDGIAPAGAMYIEDKQKTNKEEDNKKSSGGSYTSLEKSSEKLFENAAAAASHQIQYLGNSGELESITKSDVIRHFLDKNYSMDFINKIIERFQQVKTAIGNPYKVLEFKAKDLEAEDKKPKVSERKPVLPSQTYEPIKNPVRVSKEFFNKPKGKK